MPERLVDGHASVAHLVRDALELAFGGFGDVSGDGGEGRLNRHPRAEVLGGHGEHVGELPPERFGAVHTQVAHERASAEDGERDACGEADRAQGDGQQAARCQGGAYRCREDNGGIGHDARAGQAGVKRAPETGSRFARLLARARRVPHPAGVLRVARGYAYVPVRDERER